MQNSKAAPTPTAISLKLSNSAKPNACSKSDFEIFGNTKGFPLAREKEDPRVCE